MTTSVPSIVAPQIREDEQLRPSPQIIRQSYERRETRWRPRNVNFRHDPHWRERLFSLQYVHNNWWKDPLWLTVAILFALGQASLILMGFLSYARLFGWY